MSVTDVIDFRGYVPLRQCIDTIVSPPPELGRYVEKYHLDSAHDLVMSPNELVELLDEVGIAHMVLAGLGTDNEDLAKFFQAAPRRLSGIAYITPQRGLVEAVHEVRRSYDMGFRLVGLGPYRDRLRASDRQYYPIYSVCAELGMGVVIHTSFNFGRGLMLDHGRPLHLDQVATDFAELPIIASHGGWPWVLEMIAVAWHHENIYIELSAHSAKHMSKPGSGWEPIFNYGSGPLRTRLLWGSTYPAFDLGTQLAETRQLPFLPRALTQMLTETPRELLKKIGVTQ